MSPAIFSPTRDKNEPAIILALEAVGCTVQKLHEGGVPDLLVGFKGATYQLEVKGELGPKGGIANRTLTETQAGWWAWWAGKPPIIVRTCEEALATIGLQVVSPGLYLDADGSPKTYPRPKRKTAMTGAERQAKYYSQSNGRRLKQGHEATVVAFVDSHKSVPCMDCGGAFDPVCNNFVSPGR